MRKLMPPFLISFYHAAMAVMSAFIYRFPSHKLKVIGITGTNGKTTTCHLITEILERAGFKVGMTTSIDFKIKDKIWPNNTKQSMLGRFKLNQFLRQMVKAGCDYAVIETTSEGIKQWRHFGIIYDIAVFTNLTPEHLEAQE